MEKQFTLRELETVHQFFMDGKIGQSNKEFILDQEVADKTEALIQKYQTKNFKKGIIFNPSNKINWDDALERIYINMPELIMDME